MSEIKKYFYLKVKETFFDSEEMKILESQKNGIVYQNLYLKLSLLSLKSEGALVFKDAIPYDETMLSSILRVDIDTIRVGIELFKRLHLVEVLDNGTMYISDIQAMIGRSSSEGERVKAYRERIKSDNRIPIETYEKRTNVQNRTPELELELELELKKELETDSASFTLDPFVPKTKTKPVKKISPSEEVDPLYHPIEESFLSQGNFANYKKEGACIHAIIKSIRNLTPDTPEDTARKILENFKALTSGNDKFWKDRPFLPSGLSPVLEQVWTIAKKGSAVPSMDWYDELMSKRA